MNNNITFMIKSNYGEPKEVKECLEKEKTKYEDITLEILEEKDGLIYDQIIYFVRASQLGAGFDTLFRDLNLLKKQTRNILIIQDITCPKSDAQNAFDTKVKSLAKHNKGSERNHCKIDSNYLQFKTKTNMKSKKDNQLDQIISNYIQAIVQAKRKAMNN